MRRPPSPLPYFGLLLAALMVLPQHAQARYHPVRPHRQLLKKATSKPDLTLTPKPASPQSIPLRNWYGVRQYVIPEFVYTSWSSWSVYGYGVVHLGGPFSSQYRYRARLSMENLRILPTGFPTGRAFPASGVIPSCNYW